MRGTRQELVGDAFLITVASLALAFLASCHHHHRSRKAGSTLNRAPSAALSVSGDRKVGLTVTFDGRASSDPDGDVLSADWALVSKPAASQLEASSLGHPSPSVAALVPDRGGSYRVRLTVSDGELLATASATVLIEAGDGGGDGDGDGDGGDNESVALICPSRGHVEGGDLVSLFGGFFPEGTAVRFGSTLGLEAQVLEEGSLITVRTPPASAPGVVDVTVELAGDQVILLPSAFTYLPGPLAIEVSSPIDVALNASPTSLAALGEGSLLLGFARGTVQLLTGGSGGAPALSEPLQADPSGRFSRLHAGARRSDGSVDVGAVLAGGSKAYVIRVSPEGRLSAIPLAFQGNAIDIAILDFDEGGEEEVLVADRSNQRVVVYSAVSTGAGGGEGFSPTAELATAGSPCVLAAAQLDRDPGVEVVVGCFPGTDTTLIDPSREGIRTIHQDLEGNDGILLLVAGDFTGRGQNGLATVVVDGVAADPEGKGHRALRLLTLASPGDGSDPVFAFDGNLRFDLKSGTTGLDAADLDLDGDLDLALFDGSSGNVIVLVNTLVDGPETLERCAEILETGDRAPVFGLRELRLPAFPRSGIEALAAADLDGDGFPDLAASHSRDLKGLRILPNATGK